MNRGCILLAMAHVLGCTDDPARLLVDVQTDLVVGVEFSGVEVRVAGEAISRVALVGEDWSTGMRAAEFDGLSAGPTQVDVQAVHAGSVILRRSIVADVQATTAVTIVFTRDCVGVVCPQMGDSPNEVACLGGRCVDPACIDGTQAECGEDRECERNNECPNSMCASPLCSEGGVCLFTASTCSERFYCDLSNDICRELPDDGNRDSGPEIRLDAAVDASPPADASLMDTATDVSAPQDATLDIAPPGDASMDGEPADSSGSDAVVDSNFDDSANLDASCTCDDTLVCTFDDCSSGSCEHTPRPQGTHCGGGRVCGGATACVACTAELCDDSNACTDDLCGASGCLHVNNGSCATLHVTAGSGHSCAVLQDQTMRCWGANGRGQLGDGSTMDRPSPVVVSGLAGVADASAGLSFTCARLQNGQVWCWGQNGFGQLGNDSRMDSPIPVMVPGITTAVSVDTSGNHACARLSNGQAMCWGSNVSGEQGDGTTTTLRMPVFVSNLSNALDVDVGWTSFTCAARDTGQVACWGANNFWQLGSRGGDASSPREVGTVGSVVDVAGGWGHACTLSSTGEVWCWGRLGDAGQLGNGQFSGSRDPVSVMIGADGVQIDAGANFTCTLHADARVRCWGSNADGQLGDASTINRATPVLISGLTNVTQLSTGVAHACALSSGQAWCWGRNESGELGDTTTTNRSAPVQVQGL